MSKITWERFGTDPAFTEEPTGGPAPRGEECERIGGDNNGLLWFCTLGKGHEGQHVAHDFGVPYLAWIDVDE